MSRWGAPLRIARRTVRRSLGRSLLVAVLVGLPVAGATLVDILVRTFTDPAREASRSIGSADASVTVTQRQRLENYTPTRWSEGQYAGEGSVNRTVSGVRLADQLPPGSTIVRDSRESMTKLSVGDRVVRASVVVTPLGVALSEHTARLEAGAWPQAPDEVAVTRPLAERLGVLDSGGDLEAGAETVVTDGPRLRITALAEQPFCLNCESVLARPGSMLARSADDLADGETSARYLVDLPPGVDLPALWTRLADHGVALVPRDAWLHPERYEPDTGTSLSVQDLQAAALAALVTGLGLLEVVLLAGTAFAVGARRQVRELGVLSAAGATGRQVRRVLLAQGLVLGGLGSVLGIAFGSVLALAGRPLWERLDNGVITGWSFGPIEIAIAALVGAISGLLAAVVPAIGAARMAPVDALSGRFRVSRASRRRTPTVGLVLVVVGVALGLIGDRMMASAFAEYVRALNRTDVTGGYVSPPAPTLPVMTILLGAVSAVVGVVVLSPALITWLGRHGRRLPLSGRLATRDAARHRHRTGPATSAISVAVAGSVVFAFVLAGEARATELQYIAGLPERVLAVQPDDPEAGGAPLRQAADAAAVELPATRQVEDRRLRANRIGGPESELYAEISAGVDCADGCTVPSSGTAAVADPALIELALGRPMNAEERAALSKGSALVLSHLFVRADGKVKLDGDLDRRRPVHLRLPAVVALPERAYASLPSVFVSADVVADRGLGAQLTQMLVEYGADATPDDVDTALAAAEANGSYAFVEQGPSDPSRGLMLMAAAAAGFVTVVGVAISVALSAAEGRADLATLAAVGAPPRRRRSLAASQAALVGGLGCLLGLGLGAFVAYTLRSTVGADTWIVPWSHLLIVGIAVPAVAVAVAAIFTPSRLPLVARRQW